MASPFLTIEEVKRRLAEKNITLLGEYTGTDNRITVRCNIHCCEYDASARSLLSDKKRLKCCGDESRKLKLTGRAISEQTRRKCREVQVGEKAHWYGKHLSEKHKLAIKVSVRNKYRSVDGFSIQVALAKTGKTAGKPGWFYIARMTNGLLKLGSTRFDDEWERFRHFNRFFGCTGILLFKTFVQDAGLYEAEMFEKYRQYWVHGEFFEDFMIAENAEAE